VKTNLIHTKGAGVNDRNGRNKTGKGSGINNLADLNSKKETKRVYQKLKLLMVKPKDSKFKDKDAENFYNGERVLKFQELSRGDKQSAHRKVVLVYQAKN
jgi:hypothetical protein